MLYTNHYNTVVISSCISISYAGLAILLPLFYPANAPDNGMILFQLFFIILIFILGVQVFSRNKITGCLLSIILFQYVTSITLRYYYTLHFGNPLGYNPIDSWLYHSTGVAVQNYSLEELFTYLKCNSFNIDDWGFPLIVYFTYHIFGANIGIDLLLLFNILVITISSFRLYQLAGYFLEKSYALLVTFIWGTLPFLAYTTVVGLKENFFLFFTISSLYYMYKYLQKKNLKNLLYFLAYTAGLFFFRYALVFMMFISLITGLLLFNSNSSKRLKYLLIGGFILGGLAFKIAVDFIATLQGGSYEALLYAVTYRVDENSYGGAFTMLVNFIAMIIGPFPNFISDSDKANYITIYSYTSFIKMLFSFFFLYGIWYIFKRKLYYYLPMLAFIFLQSIMIFFTFYTLHIRYQLPHIPFQLIIAGYGLNVFVHRQSKVGKRLLITYMGGVFILILIYNLRLS